VELNFPRYWTADDIEDFNERAAIIEEACHVSREVSEQRALKLIEAKVRGRMQGGTDTAQRDSGGGER